MAAWTEFIEGRLALKINEASRLSLVRRIVTSLGFGCD